MHCHDHPPHATTHRPGQRRRLRAVLLLSVGYMAAEVVGGLLTNSLALLADAGHMLSDAAALALSLLAVWIAERPPTAQRTYGFYRTEILAALVNGAALVAVSLYIFVEAYHRLRSPPVVLGGTMMAVAAGGLVVNLVSLWLLGEGKEQSLNVRGAWLHVLTDAFGSVAAIVAGLLIWAWGWQIADPLLSALIGLLIVYSAWRLVLESVSILMESAPVGIDVDAIRDAMVAVPGVAGVHDLHVWSITSGMDCLSAHVVLGEGPTPAELLTGLRRVLAERFSIHHVTIQIEPEDYEEHAGHR